MKTKIILMALSVVFLVGDLSRCPTADTKTIEAATHTHTAECYLGTKHSHTGSSSSGTGCYQGDSYTSHCWGCENSQYIATDTRTVSEGSCDSCSYIDGPYIEGYVSGTYDCPAWGCNGTMTAYNYTQTYEYCTVCGNWESTLLDGIDHNCSTTYSLSCGKTEGKYYDSNGNACEALCNKIVTSLTVNSVNQEMEIGEAIDTSATATFLDGHTESVDCEYQTK